ATQVGTKAEGARILGRVLTGWSVSLVAGVPLSALIAERFGWKASFVVLDGMVLLGLVGFLRMPEKGSGQQGQTRIPSRSPIRAFGIHGVAPLLTVQFLFMTAFYGTYAFFGDHLRSSLDLSAGFAGLVVLFYGIGFGLAALGDGIVDRIGPARVLPAALGFVALAYATMPLTATALVGAFLAACLWGFSNHFVLNVLVLRLSDVAGDARGAVLGLNTAITYCGALVGPLALGAVYAGAGFGWLALGAAGCVGLAAVVSVTTRREVVA
ncbi:MAG: MFS transporter, partial [Jannaschia sp.]